MNGFRFFLASALSVCLSAVAVPLPAPAQNVPPKAEARLVTDEYFGLKITDPYRWMEDLKADETRNWIKAQADFSRAYLDKVPMRGDILERLNNLSDTSVTVGGVRPHGDLFFYTKRNPGEPDDKLYVRKGVAGPERLLADPTKIHDGGNRYSLGGWNISWDGKYVSYIVYPGGSEVGEIRVVETASGKDMGERIDRANFSEGEWLPDGKSFLYNRLQKITGQASPTEIYQKIRVHLHILGTNPDLDRPVFGFDVNPNMGLDQSLLPFPNTDPNWSHVLVSVNSGVSPNIEVYAAPLRAVNRTPVPWRKIVGFEDDVTGLSLRGDDLYLRTYKNAPRYKIVRMSLARPNFAEAEVFFSDDEAVVEDSKAQRDALYVQTLAGGSRQIRRVDYKTRKIETIKPPRVGSIRLTPTETGMAGVYFRTLSFTQSTAHFRYDPRTGTSTDTKLVPSIPIDMSHVEVVNAKAASHDGVMIPLVILHKTGLKRDGLNPTVMDGYGAYGYENTSPDFLPGILPWLERGGVYVLTGVRGGGEYGTPWHEAGQGKTKPNTWKDFIACAEYVITRKYTSPERLGIQGVSAGGVLIANAMTERPELFGAALINVGYTNVLRGETTPSGVLNIPEFGSAKTEEGFRTLLAMDGYLKIKDGVKYPAVLLMHGINDPRVEPWMSAKTAARLQAATTSGKPVLLRIDYDAGHGGGTTQKQRNEGQADAYAFLLEQLGMKDK